MALPVARAEVAKALADTAGDPVAKPGVVEAMNTGVMVARVAVGAMEAVEATEAVEVVEAVEAVEAMVVMGGMAGVLVGMVVVVSRKLILVSLLISS